MSVNACLAKTSKAEPMAVRSREALEKIERIVFVALESLFKQQDSLYFFKTRAFCAKHLIHGAPKQKKEGADFKITDSSLLSSLKKDLLDHLRELLIEFPSGSDLSLLHFLGTLILKLTKPDPKLHFEFLKNLYTVSTLCLSQKLSSRADHQQTLIDTNSLMKASMALFKEVLKETDSSEKEKLIKTFALFHQYIHPKTFKEEDLFWEKNLESFFPKFQEEKLEDFELNFDLAQRFLDLMKKNKTLNLSKRTLEGLCGSIEFLKKQCSQKESPKQELAREFFRFTECALDELLSAHKKENKVDQIASLTIVLNLVGPFLNYIQQSSPKHPVFLLLERIERVIEVLDSSISRAKRLDLENSPFDTCTEVTLFLPSKVEEHFGVEIKQLYDPNLFSLFPKYLSQIFRAKKLLACLKAEKKFTSELLKATSKIALFLSDKVLLEVKSDLAHDAFFGIFQSLIHFYLLKDLKHLLENHHTPFTKNLPKELLVLLEKTHAIDDDFFDHHIELLRNESFQLTRRYRNSDDWSDLLELSISGRTDQLRWSAHHGADIDFQNEYGFAQIHVAAEYGHLEYLEALIQQGSNVNLQSHRGTCALFLAAQEGHTKALIYLIRAGALVNLEDNEGNTPIIFAAKNDHTESLIALIDAGALVNLQNNEGTSSLNQAAQAGNRECVEILLKAGAKVDLQDDLGHSALMSAILHGHQDVVEVLIRAKADVNLVDNTGVSALMIAVDNQDNDCIHLLIQAGANLNLQTQSGATALMISGQKDTIDPLIALLGAEANLDIVDRNGCSALILASDLGKKESVVALVKAGAKLDIQDEQGDSALTINATHLHLECFETLVEAGANLDLQNNLEMTALMIAAQNNQLPFLDVLIRKKAKLNLINHHGYSALFLALTNNSKECFEALVNANADLNLQDSSGYTPLMLAITNHQIDFVKILLSRGVFLDLREKTGYTALMLSVFFSDFDCLKLLLEAGANPNLQHPSGHSALLISVEKNLPPFAKLLIDHRANIDISNNQGLTPLLMASWYGHNECCELLVSSKAKLDGQWSGLNPLSLAEYRGNLICAEILRKAGASLAKKVEAIDVLTHKDLIEKAHVKQDPAPIKKTTTSTYRAPANVRAKKESVAVFDPSKDIYTPLEKEIVKSIKEAKNFDEIVDILKAHRFYLIRQNRHAIYTLRGGSSIVAVPTHGELKRGTAKGIAEQAIEAMRQALK